MLDLKQNKKLTELAEDIKDKVDTCEAYKRELTDKWHTSIAFTNGDQYSVYRGGRGISPKMPSYRVRLTNNMVRPIVTTLISKLTRADPGITARPRKADVPAESKALVVRGLYNYLHRRYRYQEKIRSACWWAVVTGTGFLKWHWEANRGAPMTEFDPDTGEEITVSYSGAPVVRVIEPWDVFPDWNATDLDECKWIAVRHSMHVDDVKSKFPTKKRVIDTFAERHKNKFDDEYTQIRRELAGYTESDSHKEDQVYVYEYEEAPTDPFPDGRRIFTLDNKYVLSEETLINSRYSLAMMRDKEQGGRFFGVGTVEDVIDQQRELNRTISQAVELRNMHTNPSWVMPAGSVRSPIEGGRPDQIIEYNPNYGPPPTRVEPVPVPASLWQMVEAVTSSMYDITGVHEVSMGKAGKITSGRAMGYLADLDESKLGPTVASMERMIEDMARGITYLWSHFSDAPATFHVVGMNMESEVYTVHAEDLQDVEVEIIAGSMLPRNPSYTREQVVQYAQLGIFGNVQDPMVQLRIREILGQNGYDSSDPHEDMHLRRSRLEHMWFMEEEEIEVRFFEDDQVHLREHVKFCHTFEFNKLPEEEQKKMFAHIAQHMHQASQKAQGVPVYSHELGLDAGVGVGEAQALPQNIGIPPQEPAKLPGGTPELNGAMGPEQTPFGPGIGNKEFTGGEQ